MKAFYLSCVLALASFVLLCQANSIGLAGLAELGRDERGPRSRRDIKKIETINEAVDLALREVRPIMINHGLDPLKAGNTSTQIILTGLTMTNMLICNLSTIRRQEDIVVLDDEPGRLLTARVKLNFDDLMLISKYKASTLFVASIGNIKAEIPDLYVDFTFEINFEKLTVLMTSFNLINGNSAMKVHFSGNLESFLINPLSGFIIFLIDDLMLSIVAGPVKTQINNVLGIINNMLNTTMHSLG